MGKWSDRTCCDTSYNLVCQIDHSWLNVVKLVQSGRNSWAPETDKGQICSKQQSYIYRCWLFHHIQRPLCPLKPLTSKDDRPHMLVCLILYLCFTLVQPTQDSKQVLLLTPCRSLQIFYSSWLKYSFHSLHFLHSRMVEDVGSFWSTFQHGTARPWYSPRGEPRISGVGTPWSHGNVNVLCFIFHFAAVGRMKVYPSTFSQVSSHDCVVSAF